MVGEALQHQVNLGPRIQAMVWVALFVLFPGVIKGLGKAVGVVEQPIGGFGWLAHRFGVAPGTPRINRDGRVLALGQIRAGADQEPDRFCRIRSIKPGGVAITVGTLIGEDRAPVLKTLKPVGVQAYGR